MHRSILASLCFVAAPLTSQTLVTTNKDASTASIIDLKSGNALATLPTGKSPHELAVSPDGKLVVVTDYAGPDNTLTVIDLAARSVLRKISFAPYHRPHGAVFIPASHRLLVTAERDSAVVLVDVDGGKILQSFATGSRVGHMAVLSPAGDVAYVANINPGELSIVDLTGKNPPVVLHVGSQTEGIGITPDGNAVWMGSNATGTVYVVNTHTRTVVDSFATPSAPYRIAFTPDSRTALVTNPTNSELRIVDASTRKILHVVDMSLAGIDGTLPQGIAVSRDGPHAWVTLGKASRVAEVDVVTGRVARWLSSDAGPDGVIVVEPNS